MTFKVECPLFNYSDSDKNQLYQEIVIDIRVAVACFSFLGSLFVIFLIWLFKKYKFYVQRLILYLSVSAFLSATAYILGRIDYDPSSTPAVRFCVFQGFFLLYTDWTVLLSIFCITFNLLWSVFTDFRIPKIELIYFSVIFILPAAISCIPFFQDSFGPSGAWCWIRSQTDNCSEYMFGTALQFGVWYVPQYLFIILLFVMYIAIMVKLTIKTRTWQGTYDPIVERKRELLKEEIKPLLWYPTVYFAVCLLPLINRIVSNLGHDPIFPLYVLHVLSSPLQGALTALTYALDRQTLKRLRWRTIKASVRYRNTDAVVHDYPVGPKKEEAEPFLKESLNYTNSQRPKQT